MRLRNSFGEECAQSNFRAGTGQLTEFLGFEKYLPMSLPNHFSVAKSAPLPKVFNFYWFNTENPFGKKLFSPNTKGKRHLLCFWAELSPWAPSEGHWKSVISRNWSDSLETSTPKKRKKAGAERR